jgi:hypothetical protein
MAARSVEAKLRHNIAPVLHVPLTEFVFKMEIPVRILVPEMGRGWGRV